MKTVIYGGEDGVKVVWASENNDSDDSVGDVVVSNSVLKQENCGINGDEKSHVDVYIHEHGSDDNDSDDNDSDVIVLDRQAPVIKTAKETNLDGDVVVSSKVCFLFFLRIRRSISELKLPGYFFVQTKRRFHSTVDVRVTVDRIESNVNDTKKRKEVCKYN